MGKLEGENHMEHLGIDGWVILNEYARNRLELNWFDLSLDRDLCQAVVTTILSHWVV